MCARRRRPRAFAAGLGALAGQAKLAARNSAAHAASIVVLDPADDERPLHQNFVVYQQRLTAVAKLLGEQGIQLGVGFTATPEQRAGRAFRVHPQLRRAQAAARHDQGDKNVGVVPSTSYELWASRLGLPSRRRGRFEARRDLCGRRSRTTSRSRRWRCRRGRLLPGETGVHRHGRRAAKHSPPPATTAPSSPLPHPVPDFQGMYARGQVCKLAERQARRMLGRPRASNRPAKRRSCNASRGLLRWRL
jgi:hypothetical protein